MKKQDKPKAKLTVGDVENKIKKGDYWSKVHFKQGHNLNRLSANAGAPVEKKKLDSLAKARFGDMKQAYSMADQGRTTLAKHNAVKKQKAEAVQKKVSSSLFKTDKPLKPTVIKKK